MILFTSGSEGTPKAVVLTNRSLLANVFQAEARISLLAGRQASQRSAGLPFLRATGGTILPLVNGVFVFLYPSPLHYKIIPEIARKISPTIMFGTDTFLAAYARTAKAATFPACGSWSRERKPSNPRRESGASVSAPRSSKVSASPRRLPWWRSTRRRTAATARSAACCPACACGSSPSRAYRRRPALAFRTHLMRGYMTADRPGELQRLDSEWLDTGDIVFDREGFMTIRGRANASPRSPARWSRSARSNLVQALWPEDNHAAVPFPTNGGASASSSSPPARCRTGSA